MRVQSALLKIAAKLESSNSSIQSPFVVAFSVFDLILQRIDINRERIMSL